MRLPTMALCLGLWASAAFGGDVDKFKQIRVFVPDKTTLDRIWSTGIDFEGATGKIGSRMEFVAGDHELLQLRASGISYQIVIDDLASFYAARLPKEPVNALGFGYGSMGGFYTFAEVGRQLDTMRLLYPTLITAKDSIGASVEGRPIWVVKISDNPEIDEPDEPEVLYTALHHAREPQSMMAVLYYMWWLLENYGTDQDATYLTNNRQMFFIPVVNPDGYVYNQTTNPNGGGMWRKNRRNNGGGIYGVDPNRNYGPYYMWNSSNGGSSTSPSSETYRGTAPFSEPENRTIDRFMRSHNIKTALNYHTYGNLLIFPWGYLSRENGDSLIYRDWAYDMTSVNHYTMGTDLQTVNYATRGNSDDYMYGDDSLGKPITYTMTPEIGTSGFWPPVSQIFPLAIENLGANKLLAFFAGHDPTLRHYEIHDADGNGFIDRGEDFTIAVRLRNRGRGDAIDLNVTAATNTPHIVLESPTISVGRFSSQTDHVLMFDGRARLNAVTGVPFQLYLMMTDARGFLKRDTIDLFLGTPAIAFADSASSGIGNWSTGTGWGLTSNAHTAPNAFTDSPFGNYVSNANNPLTLNNAVSLSGYHYARLKFWTKWAVEPTWDFATVEISTNNGTTWTTLRTKLSHLGSGRSGGRQTAGTWGYEAYTPGLTWVEQEVDLNQYVNQQIKLRFRMSADGADQRDGFYVDDIRLYGYVVNADTHLVAVPNEFRWNGPTGRVFGDSLRIYNLTNRAVHITIAESVSTLSEAHIRATHSGAAGIPSLIAKLKAAARNGFSLTSFANDGSSGPGVPSDPQTFTTIITDDRNELGNAAADVYRVQHQLRTVPFIGTFHDFRIVLGNLPDTNVAGFISLDTDQDFGSGAFPTPFGIGPTSRDIGSEREVFFDASGILVDSIFGIGRIPAGAVLSTTTDSIIGSPFLLTITRDSVTTVTTNGLGLGIRSEWIDDADGKITVGLVASRIGPNVNPLPDFAPLIGHGVIGAETGVSWTTEDRTSLTLASGDSAIVRITGVAAKPQGSYSAMLRLIPDSGVTTTVPITMTVVNPQPPVILVSPTSFADTVFAGDSVLTELTVSNAGGTMLMFGILDTMLTPWITVLPTFGLVEPGQSTTAFVTVRSSGLLPDSTYRATLLVLSNDPAAGTVAVNVALTVIRVTAVRDPRTIPTTFALHQNFPNPFNPKTEIRFDLPSAEFVSLRVYNLLGQEAAVLVDERLDPGGYSVELNTSRYSLSSGVYFYELHAGTFSAVKKFILIK